VFKGEGPGRITRFCMKIVSKIMASLYQIKRNKSLYGGLEYKA
jgi:hypothetical protein